MNLKSKNRIISRFFDEGYLLSSDLARESSSKLERLYQEVIESNGNFPTTLTIQEAKQITNVERSREKREEELEEKMEETKEIEKEKPTEVPYLEVKQCYEPNTDEKNLRDFVRLYRDRYKKISKFLRSRSSYKDAVSLSNLKDKQKENVTTIGLVKDKRTTRSGNVLIELEDPSGTMPCLINDDKDVFKKAEKVVLDEVIGIKGFKSNDFIFINELNFPDIPNNHTNVKNAEGEGYAVFFGDSHVGSEYFLEDVFEKSINWLRGRIGNERQREIAKKTKYLFFLGDLVDGVGIYPDQEDELRIKNIEKQYEAFAQYIKQVPDRIRIVIIPGNHDALRLAEPQPALDRDLASSIYEIDNVDVLSNPSTVSISADGGGKNLDVLLYHGYSFDWYIGNVPYLREYGYDHADKVMKFFLKKRHLAPTHSSAPFIPDPKDHMIIENVPDIFAAGHTHKAVVGSYKNTKTLMCSCFQETTPYQKWMGHHPQPGRVPVVNLKNRKTRVMKFS